MPPKMFETLVFNPSKVDVPVDLMLDHVVERFDLMESHFEDAVVLISDHVLCNFRPIFVAVSVTMFCIPGILSVIDELIDCHLDEAVCLTSSQDEDKF